MGRPRTSSKKTKRAQGRAEAGRTKAVWGALAMSMSVAGGILWLTQGGADASNLQLTALAAVEKDASGDLSTNRPVQAGRWGAIVVHHSSSPVGSLEQLDREHSSSGRDGSPYHFVIENGSGSGDGSIRAGARWKVQESGSHVRGPHADAMNASAIGICLIGDGDRENFSASQTTSLVRLVTSLQDQLGIPADRVYLHRDLTGTSSPGRRFPAAMFREQLLINP